MEYKTLSVQKNDHIAVITFQNPAMLNALTPAFLEEYGHLLDELQRVPDISVVIVTGEGKAFIWGRYFCDGFHGTCFCCKLCGSNVQTIPPYGDE